jgi:hypothetical protein
LTQPIVPLNRRIGIRQPAANSASADGPRAVLGWAGQVSGGYKPPHRALASCGPPVATEKSFFSVLFSEHSFNCFVQFFLSKFHIVFSIRIIPTKILFREFKSYRNFFIKFKVYEFYSCFRCK